MFRAVWRMRRKIRAREHEGLLRASMKVYKGKSHEGKKFHTLIAPAAPG
jgi:hypothetical protein